MSEQYDQARSIASMLSKLTDDERRAFNEVVALSRPPAVEARSDDAALVVAAEEAVPWIDCIGDPESCEKDPCEGCKARQALRTALAERGAAAAPGADWKAEALAWRAWDKARLAAPDWDGDPDEEPLDPGMLATWEPLCRIRALNERAAAAPETP